MTKKIAVIISFCISISVFSQKSRLHGKTVHDSTNMRAADTRIYLTINNDTLFRTSDFSGEFLFEDLKMGTYKIHAENIGDGLDYFDSTVNIERTENNFDIRMKPIDPDIYGYNWQNYIEFRYRQAANSITTFEYTIKRDSIFLNQTRLTYWELKPKREIVKRYFPYALNESERQIVDSIIVSNELDKVSTYARENMAWGPGWEIIFEENGIHYKIDMPKYHNQGLEELIKFVSSLVPESEKFRGTR